MKNKNNITDRKTPWDPNDCGDNHTPISIQGSGL